MTSCPSCGKENPAEARFCLHCGTAMATVTPTVHEERKVVTILFVDLVGFTSESERLDPEDVRALLSPYYERVRAELEHFGGTVEKFIGDAVMAIFGAPVAHEDDPERAVRAALAIRDWASEDGGVQLRIGVNTGEALISLGARPLEGEGMAAGDVVNTAARLQSAAPVHGVLVGASTYRATRQAIDYDDAEPVLVKGKAAPVAVWRAVQPRARLGIDVPIEAKTELVGRDRELRVLREALDRVRADHSTQLVTLVGVPGIGKSRLLFELWKVVEAESDLTFWRQGRSLPYGEGASYWALAEMVKAHAGILESDAPEEAQVKLETTVTSALPDPREADWVVRHLRALLGFADAQASGGGDARSEAFAAWRRFFEALAEQRPLITLFEDLHWADDGLLDFVDHLADWAGDVPLLVVCSARPELLDRRPGWGGGKPNAVTLSLSPLSDDDTARLLGALMGRPVVDAELLLRAGGNPLYAEQFAQMATEAGSDAGLPESVQGIVGARLDALGIADKQLLQDAAVIGKVFWPGAVAALSDSAVEDSALATAMHSLDRKQFIRRERRSAVLGETQYSFLHVLLRDVAYSQIPRAARARKHARAAAWIESLGRPDDHAEMVAHHYRRALDFATSANQDVSELRIRAGKALRAAGDRALVLNAFDAAADAYRDALGVQESQPSEERAELTLSLGIALARIADRSAAETLDAARLELLNADMPTRAAVADAELAQLSWLRGDHDGCIFHSERAYDAVRREPASPEKVEIMSSLVRFQMLARRMDRDIAAAALDMAESLGLTEQRANLLVTIGSDASDVGDSSGVPMLERGLALAIEHHYYWVANRGYANLAVYLELAGDLRGSVAKGREAALAARQLGTAGLIRWSEANLATALVGLGDWDVAGRMFDEFAARSEELGPHYLDSMIHVHRAAIRLARDDIAGALADQALAERRSAEAKDPQLVDNVRAVSAYLFAELGRPEDARRPLDQVLATDTATSRVAGPLRVDLAVAALQVERAEAASRWFRATPPGLWRTAALSVLTREFAEAIRLLDAAGARPTAGLVRLTAARELVRRGDRAAAQDLLEPARSFYSSVGARRFLRLTAELIAA